MFLKSHDIFVNFGQSQNSMTVLMGECARLSQREIGMKIGVVYFRKCYNGHYLDRVARFLADKAFYSDASRGKQSITTLTISNHSWGGIRFSS